MAVFIPSQVDSTMRSLSSWNQAQTRDKQMAIAQAQAQLQELARLGIRDSRVDDATKRLMGGGALFGSLRPGAQMDVPGLTSAQAQTGQNAQARDYSGQKNLDIAQKKSSALVGQERLEQLRGKETSQKKDKWKLLEKSLTLASVLLLLWPTK